MPSGHPRFTIIYVPTSKRKKTRANCSLSILTPATMKLTRTGSSLLSAYLLVTPTLTYGRFELDLKRSRRLAEFWSAQRHDRPRRKSSRSRTCDFTSCRNSPYIYRFCLGYGIYRHAHPTSWSGKRDETAAFAPHNRRLGRRQFPRYRGSRPLDLLGWINSDGPRSRDRNQTSTRNRASCGKRTHRTFCRARFGGYCCALSTCLH
jgi:hypothetical protein